MAANIFIVVTLIMIYVYNFELLATTEAFERNKSDTADFKRIPMIIGVSIYAFEAIGLIIGIRNELEHPK